MTLINLAVLLVLGVVVVSVVVASRREPGERGGVVVVAGIAVLFLIGAFILTFVWAVSTDGGHYDPGHALFTSSEERP
jgi:hypothetical protein